MRRVLGVFDDAYDFEVVAWAGRRYAEVAADGDSVGKKMRAMVWLMTATLGEVWVS
jgi:hypothetical protein